MICIKNITNLSKSNDILNIQKILKMENNKFFIIIPLYNDWKSLWKLIHKIEKNIYNLNAEFYIIVVNDASTIKRSNIELNLNKIISYSNHS